MTEHMKFEQTPAFNVLERHQLFVKTDHQLVNQRLSFHANVFVYSAVGGRGKDPK